VTSPDAWAYEFIRVDLNDGVLVCTLDRPHVLNAVHAPMHHEITALFARIADDRPEDGVEIVILTGAGRAFCAGGDIKTLPSGTGEPGAPLRHPLRAYSSGSPLLRHLLSITQPIIASVNGDAVGLGATLALCCDIVLASDKARFGDPHVNRGLVAGDGGALIWPMLIGPNRAKEFLMTGDLLSAGQAERMGLVNHVHPADELADAAMALANRLSGLPTAALRWTKQSVNKAVLAQMTLLLDTSLALERITQIVPQPNA
jgi:enoyl-CoA hydratase